MRIRAIRDCTLLLALTLAAISASEAQGPPPACASSAMFIDSLRAYARAAHPTAFEPARQDSAMIVGLVLDADCHLLHHALGRRSEERLTVDSAMARLFPARRVRPWTTSGFATIGFKPAGPWIAWTVLAPSGAGP